MIATRTEVASATGRPRRLFTRADFLLNEVRSRTKLPLYAESGIREVWIVDLQHDEF